MKLSIIVPVYNTDTFLAECLNSIKSQTFTDWECILVDDGSTDNSPQICDDIAKEDGRFKVIHKPNEGVSSARNIGIKEAKGEWIAFVDSDDWLEPECYETAFKHSNECNVIQWNFNVIGKSKAFRYSESEPGLTNLNSERKRPEFFYVVWDKIFKAELIKDLYFRDTQNDEDVIFLVELQIIEPKVFVIKDKLINHRILKNSLFTRHKTGIEVLKCKMAWKECIKKLNEQENVNMYLVHFCLSRLNFVH